MYTNSEANLVFTKTKVTPRSKKTLPSLQLLALFLAIQCIVTMVKEKKFHVTIRNLTFLTDSQVALSWVLSKKVVKNNVFVTNRIKDISSFEGYLNETCIVPCYKYVPSTHNVADILTRPVNIAKFMEHKQLWLHCPT